MFWTGTFNRTLSRFTSQKILITRSISRYTSSACAAPTTLAAQCTSQKHNWQGERNLSLIKRHFLLCLHLTVGMMLSNLPRAKTTTLPPCVALLWAPSLNDINKVEHGIYIYFLCVMFSVVIRKENQTWWFHPISDLVEWYHPLRGSRTPSPDTIYPLHVATLLCLIGWLLCWWLWGSKACCRLAPTDVIKKSSSQQSS